MSATRAAIAAALKLLRDTGVPTLIAKSDPVADPARRLTIPQFDARLTKIMTKLMSGPNSPAQKAARDYMARFTVLGEDSASKDVGLAIKGAGGEAPPNIVIEFDIPTPPEVRQALIENTGDLITKVSEDLQQRIVDIVREARLDGKNIGDTAKIIEARTGFSTNRSRMIARTESLRAFNLAAEYRYQGHGIAWMEWNSADDERTNGDICADLNGNQYPVRGNHPPMPAHPQCRCGWIPILNPRRTAEIREVFPYPSKDVLEGMDPIDRRQMLIGPSPVYPWESHGSTNAPVPA